MASIKKVYNQTMRRWTWFIYQKRRILKRKIEDVLIDNARLHIGCGEAKLKGYINIDIVPTEGADVVLDVSKELYLIPSNIAIEVRLEQAFEHFYRYHQEEILQEFHRILKKEGKLVLVGVPDFDAVIDGYLKKKIGRNKQFDLNRVYTVIHGDPEPHNSPQQLHKDIFTEDSLRRLLENNGFRIESLTRGDGSFEEGLAMSIVAMPIKP